MVVVLALASCAPQPEPAPSQPAAAPSIPVTATPEPSTATSIEPAGCDKVLDDTGNADLAADNLDAVDFEVQTWDYPLLSDFVADGVVCKWAGGGDVHVVVGQLPMDETTWEATRAALEAAGYQRDDSYGVDEFIDGPDSEDESYPTRGFAWRDGMLFYASYPGILEFAPAFQS
ncbi:hypothetical protein ACFCVO_01730 [Agromyces sp. NPDC056379]|uniref:hypothetical protein n=1 Tax=unclassified Agromyces TaxID=2639701 RepID=UPI0035E24431